MGHRLLIVDDEPNVRSALRRFLVREGYEIREAANGADALQLLELDTPPCLILLDLQMPILDGLGFLAALGASQPLGRVPAVILTASVGVPDLPVPVLEKPFQLDLVRRTVADLLVCTCATRLPTPPEAS